MTVFERFQEFVVFRKTSDGLDCGWRVTARESCSLKDSFSLWIVLHSVCNVSTYAIKHITSPHTIVAMTQFACVSMHSNYMSAPLPIKAHQVFDIHVVSSYMSAPLLIKAH